MKKHWIRLLSAVMALSLLAGCGAKPQQERPEAPENVAPGYENGLITRVSALKGPTSMGLVKLLADDQAAEVQRYEGTMYTAADEIVPLIAKGETDIALIPTNLAATLYQKTEGGVQVINVNAGNVLYALSYDESLQHMEGLKGKTVYMTGKGTTPEWTVRYLMQQNDLTDADITLEFKPESAEVLSALSADPTAAAILPQPFATVAMMQDQELSMNFSLSDEWAAKSGAGGTVTGVTIVRRAFAEEHPAALRQFLDDHTASVAYMTENTADGARLIEEYGIVGAAVADEVLAYFSPISSVSGEEMKTSVNGYLSALYEIAPEAVGGKMPDEAFYYLG